MAEARLADSNVAVRVTWADGHAELVFQKQAGGGPQALDAPVKPIREFPPVHEGNGRQGCHS
eukprot:10865892-Heterocapsa_arctica.AAC.1